MCIRRSHCENKLIIFKNLNYGKRWQIEVLTNIVDEVLHVDLVSLGVMLRRRVTLSLKPQQRFDLAILLVPLHAFLGPLHHVFVQLLPTRPLTYGGAANGARDKTQLAGHAPPHHVGEGHAGTDAAGLLGVDVGVDGFVGGFPLEGGAEAEDGRVGAALRRNDAVPVLVWFIDHTATTRHVALTGEYEDLPFGFWWVLILWICVGFHGFLPPPTTDKGFLGSL